MEKQNERLMEQMQKEMSHYMLATFADRFRDGAVAEQRNRIREEAAKAGARVSTGTDRIQRRGSPRITAII